MKKLFIVLPLLAALGCSSAAKQKACEEALTTDGPICLQALKTARDSCKNTMATCFGIK